MNEYTSISEIKGESVKRVTTGHDELDWLYGLSSEDNLYQWGIPIRTISTWVGEGGVGKSRLAINLAKYKVQHGKKVLYLQNEVDLATLAGWVGDTSDMQGFYCSDTTALSEQVSMVKELRPDFVFVDSINLIDEFGSGTAKSIKTIVDGFRDAIEGSETHVVILCQLNKEGKATGSTALSHLPDINLHLTNTEDDGVFAVSIGKKHRYGRKGKTYTSLWRHIESGVECISKNRFADDRWIVPDSYKLDQFIDFGVRRQRTIVPNTESVLGHIPCVADIPAVHPIDFGGPVPGNGPQLVEDPDHVKYNYPAEAGGFLAYPGIADANGTIRPKMTYKQYLKICKKHLIPHYPEKEVKLATAISYKYAGQIEDGWLAKLAVEFAWTMRNDTIWSPADPYGKWGLFGRLLENRDKVTWADVKDIQYPG